MPPIPRESYTRAQRQAVELFESGPRGEIFGPFGLLLRSPEVLTNAQKLGEYLRFHSIVPKKLRELAILITGYECLQPFIWYVHEPIAREAGLTDETVRAIADGRRPASMDEAETAVYDFCTEIFKNKRVSDPTYQNALRLFGEQGIIELTNINAYWSLLGMTMNVAQMSLPPDADQKIVRFTQRVV